MTLATSVKPLPEPRTTPASGAASVEWSGAIAGTDPPIAPPPSSTATTPTAAKCRIGSPLLSSSRTRRSRFLTRERTITESNPESMQSRVENEALAAHWYFHSNIVATPAEGKACEDLPALDWFSLADG